MDDYTFRVFSSSVNEGKFDANFVYSSLGARKAAVIFTQNDYGAGGKDSFVKNFTDLGGSIVAVESVMSNATDVRTQVLRIKESNPEIIFLCLYPVEGLSVLRQANELSLTVPKLATSAIQTNDLYKNDSSDFDGLMISTIRFSLDSNEPIVRNFIEKYVGAYGENPTSYGVVSFEAMSILGDALRSCKDLPNSDCVKTSLYGLNNFSGVMGATEIDRNGDALMNFQINLLRDNSLRVFK